MVKAGDSIPDVQVHAGSSVPQLKQGDVSRATATREGCGTSRTCVARRTWRRPRNGRQHAPGRSETRSATGEPRDSTHTPSRTQDGLEFNPPVFLDVRKACAGKKVLIMGLPGAFTPC